ncbi:MAG: hypothetical protein KDJ45_08675 [Hyphomicrobiaceae bacterium]|nr:hypothetical protein [Hyphomicrobiaceae bacterium]MCC0010186.1 hypothetical protein [Hyphomicrobiaceae bacterium]
MAITAGLDVGGAHLKIALVEDGVPVALQQHACALWQGIDKLDAALLAARPMLNRADRIAITMTGELSDLFESRLDGVSKLVEWLSLKLGEDIRFWQGLRGFGTSDCAIEHHQDVGSTNFLATAAIVGRHRANALLVDFGSTTTDIIAIIEGTPTSQGATDAIRQGNAELVYTGYTRTAVMGVTDKAVFKGQWVGLAREYLATMADVRRILGDIDPDVDLHSPADGRGKSLAESTQRLARMLGRDADEGTDADWYVTARGIAEAQMHSIQDGLVTILSRHPSLLDGPMVVAGIGARVAGELARRVGLKPVTFGELIGASGKLALDATHAAPATAVALLFDQMNQS